MRQLVAWAKLAGIEPDKALAAKLKPYLEGSQAAQWERVAKTLETYAPRIAKDPGLGAELADKLAAIKSEFAKELASEVRAASGDAGAADWLLDTRHQVYCFGGRFSSLMATYLLNHLRLLRPGCFALEDNAQLPDRLFDLQRQDVVLVFDYRRYQTQALRVASAAKNNNARVVLFTDIYASPLRELADMIISAPVESASPFDTMVPALAQVEALIACLTLRCPDLADRLEGIDALRNDFDTHLLEDK